MRISDWSSDVCSSDLKVFPVSGTVIAAVAMFLLSTMGTGTSQSTVTVYMVLLGIGLGLTMQTLVLATQNAVPISDLGAAPAAVSFFRSLGGSTGVPLLGALFNSRLAALPTGLDRQRYG